MKTGFSLWELTHREFLVSYTGFGFAVYLLGPKILIYEATYFQEINKFFALSCIGVVTK